MILSSPQTYRKSYVECIHSIPLGDHCPQCALIRCHTLARNAQVNSEQSLRITNKMLARIRQVLS